MANIITEPLDLVPLRKQTNGFIFSEKGQHYMVSDLTSNRDEMLAMSLETGILTSFDMGEYVKAVDTLTIRSEKAFK